MTRYVSVILLLALSLTAATAQKTVHKKPAHKTRAVQQQGIMTAHVLSPEEIIYPAELPSNAPQLPVAFRCHFGPMPQFPGDIPKFIAENLRYPDSLREAGVEGRVVVSFVIRADGRADSAHIVRSVHPLMDREAMRLIFVMPRWTPAKNSEGKPEDILFTLPVTFKLD